jgi:16S rRNA G966 N2-methylase RsmD
MKTLQDVKKIEGNNFDKVLFNDKLNGIEIYFHGGVQNETKPIMYLGGFKYHRRLKKYYAKQNEQTLLFIEGVEIAEGTPTEAPTVTRSTKNKIMPLFQRVSLDNLLDGDSKKECKLIAKQVKKHLKERFPECKFSFKSEYSSIYGYLQQSPYEKYEISQEERSTTTRQEIYSIEKEQNIIINSIIEYADSVLQSYNWDKSDLMSDYHNKNFYGHVSIDCDYKQKEQTEQDKETIEQFFKDKEEDEERKRIEWLKHCEEEEIKRAEQEKLNKIIEAQEKEITKRIIDNVQEKKLSESEQYFLNSVKFAYMNKNNTLAEYEEEIAKGEEEYNTENVHIYKEIHFKQEEIYNLFKDRLLNDFDFVKGEGGRYTNDFRMKNEENYWTLKKEELQEIEWITKGSSVYLNNKLMFIINNEGYSYSRYVGLVDDNTTRTPYTKEEITLTAEQEQLILDADMIDSISADIIIHNGIDFNLVLQGGEEQDIYKKLLIQELNKSHITLNLDIIQQLETQNLKELLYKFITVCDPIQKQFKAIEDTLKEGETLTIISDSGFGVSADHVYFKELEYTPYAQYGDNVNMIYKKPRKRKMFKRSLYKKFVVIRGAVTIPRELFYKTEHYDGWKNEQSLFSSFDPKIWDVAIDYIKEQNFNVLVNSVKPMLQSKTPTEPTPEPTPEPPKPKKPKEENKKEETNNVIQFIRPTELTPEPQQEETTTTEPQDNLPSEEKIQRIREGEKGIFNKYFFYDCYFKIWNYEKEDIEKFLKLANIYNYYIDHDKFFFRGADYHQINTLKNISDHNGSMFHVSEVLTSEEYTDRFISEHPDPDDEPPKLTKKETPTQSAPAEAPQQKEETTTPSQEEDRPCGVSSNSDNQVSLLDIINQTEPQQPQQPQQEQTTIIKHNNDYTIIDPKQNTTTPPDTTTADTIQEPNQKCHITADTIITPIQEEPEQTEQTEPKEEEKQETYNKAFNDIPEFYPTPIHLKKKMIDCINYNNRNNIKNILEPSAGRGDLAEALQKTYIIRSEANIDTIEIDQNLRHVLTGKGFKVVHDDFLTLETYKKYDLVFMNPPFKNGVKHLLKAIDLIKKGGQAICLLNAETLKNPYSNDRKHLLTLLDQYNADIQYLQNEFITADRKTGVEIALVSVEIPYNTKDSLILEDLKKEEFFHLRNEQQEDRRTEQQISHTDFIKDIVSRYNYEVKAGVKLINEYESLSPYIGETLQQREYNSSNPMISMDITVNQYISKVRYKYWVALFNSQQFEKLFTSNLREEFRDRLEDLKGYDFSEFNIIQIKAQMMANMSKSLEKTILDLFDDFSHKHHYTETSKNIHYYNGWKTNKAYKINKKVIMPLNAFDSWSCYTSYSISWNVKEKLEDIEKVFNYLDNGNSRSINLRETLEQAEKDGQTKQIETKYFYITFYKKGTCHLEFKDLDLLHKFNVYGSQRKGWLPDNYAKETYNNMSKAEKETVNNFEGKQSYQNVMNNKNYFITDIHNTLKQLQA